MRYKKQNKYKLGLFILIGILIFISAIYYIGSQKNKFGSNIRIYGFFKDISGLKVGNNARFAGINVGTVTGVQIINDSLVRVDLTIDKKVKDFIKVDSKMEIGSEGLMGNKIVTITPGDPEFESIQNDDTLETIEVINIDAIIKELHVSSQNTSVITKNLADITQKINEGEGIFGKLFTDTAFTNNLTAISKNTARLTYNFADITKKINTEQGVISKLLTDTVFSNQMDDLGVNLQTSSKNLVQITEKINEGEGIFGKIFTDTAFTMNLKEVSKNLNYTTRQTKEISDNLNVVSRELVEGKGLVKRLLLDSTFADSIEVTIYNINKSVKEIDEAAKVVKSNWFIRTFSKKDKKK